jgi:hypothetical protein
LNVKNRVRDFALLEHVLVFAKFEDRFPRAHLGEKDLGVEHVPGGLPMGASFGSTKLIDFGWRQSAKPTFALSGELLLHQVITCGAFPVSQRLPLIVRSSTENPRFFQRVVSPRAGRHRLGFLKRVNRSRVQAAAVAY